MGNMVCTIGSSKEQKERIRYICKAVLKALDVDALFCDGGHWIDFKNFLDEERCIVLFCEDNFGNSSEEFVNHLILNPGKALVIAIADTDEKLYRFLPADPFYLMKSDLSELEFIDIFVLAVKKAFR